MQKSKDTTYGLSVAALLVFAWFFIWPNVQSIDNLQAQLKKERSDLVMLQLTKDKIQQEIGFFENLSEEDKKLVDLAVPLFPDKANLINLLNKIAENNGLIVESISTKQEDVSDIKKNPGVLGTMPTVLVLEGSYPSLKEFINAAESILRIFDVEDIDILTKQQKSQAVFTVTGKAYYTR
ncbi:MAG: hypothetical protein A3H51_01410 [Candidatus Spechtbacteria bacterium RIFCSPLOWO2_02_FULL_38_8]|uniref:Pilus assembly protein PilO n=1 Tax=Candidatus Spechtbacteria bacterium RIFCSPLOWO2_02_FULL_38_8 TaxID=1802164 RepID=A0A1G2HK82_9BACT|nr:MAG: hypothetical protein A3H51_01410 [Candidatus Spechtbacteria bacterium RIFCSPLOWO2_02_FULL_38_8]